MNSSNNDKRKLMREISIVENESGFCGSFFAMASPCEVLIDTDDLGCAEKITETVAAEAWRIEQKFSRYRDDNLLYQINHAKGQPVNVDDEWSRLLDFADQAFKLSDGAFDVTSGVLRRLWKFNGSDNVPSRKAVKKLLPYIGWDKVQWQSSNIVLPTDMEIDLGGVGKEYAVDRAALLATEATDDPLLINFGGDLYATAAPKGKPHWLVGVDKVGGLASALVQLERGGLATSGDANRYLMRGGKRYSHVLNPRTGWPVGQAPSAVTVAANNCVDAGLLATFAMLAGGDAESFLQAQGCLHWVQR